MKKTYAYIISIAALLLSGYLNAQDTVSFPLKIRAGIEVSGPVLYFTDKNNFSAEGFISVDRNEKMAYALEGGFLNYKYSQYNYDYSSNGIFLKAGVDFNILRPEVSLGKYQAGISLRYGMSLFNSETPSFSHENYWGTATSSIPSKTSLGHFVEVSPGVKTEVFRNFSIGWALRLKFLISGGGGKNERPIYFPGYGNGGKAATAGVSYYLIWNIPFRTIRVPVKEDVPVESEVNGEGGEEQSIQDLTRPQSIF